MKHAAKASILILAVIGMFGLFGCGKNKQFDIHTYLNKESGTMLVDSYDRTVGTPTEQPYYELVLYTYSETQALLTEYIGGGEEEEQETEYLIPIEGAQEILSAVKNSGMPSWSGRHDLVGITGKSYVCKFPDGKGGYVRVSSDEMPANGAAAFGTVKSAMSRWLREEYRKNALD